MQPSGQLTKSVKELRARLDYVNRAWTVENYEALLQFYVQFIPKVSNAERCGIFILDPVHRRIVLKAGTNLTEGEIEAPMEGSIVGRAITSSELIIENDLTERSGFHRQTDSRTGFQTRSMVCVPIRSVAGGRTTGAVQVLNKLDEGDFSEEDANLVQEIADVLSMALDNISLNREIADLSREINNEVSKFATDYLGNVPFIAESEAMRNVMEVVRMVSSTPVDVLILGENGTGKEVIARMIHEGRERRAHPFVAVNCAAIPETLMESEFFGYEKGAFTGATGSRKGRFEEANGGTLFLDEIADMPLSMQPKFLRAIQEGEGARLGSNRVTRYDVQLITATNRDLRESVTKGEFREDLFYRLFAVEISVPPLRDRREDIAPLAHAFLDDICARFQKSVAGFSNELMTLFESYSWPGNVRQLRHEIERLVALTPETGRLMTDRCSPEVLGRSDVQPGAGINTLSLPHRVRDLEVSLIQEALERTGGNKIRAAQLLGITRQGLHKKLKRYGEDGLESQ